MSDATQDWVAMREAARATPTATRETCGHAIFMPACRSCQSEQARALQDGVGWARDMGRKRILTTNHPEVTDPAEREQLDLGPLPTMEQVGLSPSEQGPRTTLIGDDHAAFEAFSAASAALEAHAEQTAKLQADYRAALEQVSRMAAKRNRPPK